MLNCYILKFMFNLSLISFCVWLFFSAEGSPWLFGSLTSDCTLVVMMHCEMYWMFYKVFKKFHNIFGQYCEMMIIECSSNEGFGTCRCSPAVRVQTSHAVGCTIWKTKPRKPQHFQVHASFVALVWILIQQWPEHEPETESSDFWFLGPRNALRK